MSSPSKPPSDLPASPPNGGAGASPAPKSPATHEQDHVVYRNVHIHIEQATGAALHTRIAELSVPAAATLESMRAALLASPIADESHDLFFPKWTHTMYLTRADGGGEEVHSVETDDQLRAMLADELATPGTIAIKLEQCKNTKYSRFRHADRGSGGSSATSSVSGSSNQSAGLGGGDGSAGKTFKPRGKQWMRHTDLRCYDGPTVPTSGTTFSPVTNQDVCRPASGGYDARSSSPVPRRAPFAARRGTHGQGVDGSMATPDADCMQQQQHPHQLPPHPAPVTVLYPMMQNGCPFYYVAYAPYPVPQRHGGTTFYYDAPPPWVAYGSDHMHCY